MFRRKIETEPSSQLKAFLRGFGSIIHLFGPSRIRYERPRFIRDDREALRYDSRKVGEDLTSGLKYIDKSQDININV